MTHLPRLPRLDPDQNTGAPLATSCWQSSADVKAALQYVENDLNAESPVVLGQLNGELMGYDDDRHWTILGGSRAGKGDSLVIPNLLTYKGSVICIDPKGENASVTAAWRANSLGQKVYVLDPFHIAQVPLKLRRSLNPLEFLDIDSPEIIEDVGGIADAAIIPGSGKDPHWDESARSFIKGIMLFILAKEDETERSMALLRRYLTIGYPDENGVHSFQKLLEEMQKTDCPFSDAIAASATALMDAGENERGSILSTARRQTEFLESMGVQDCLKSGGLDLSEIKQDPKGVTIYLVLPEWRIATHSRWLRLIVSTLIHALERTPRGTNLETGRPLPAVLMILEEMAALGRMQSIEKAAGYIAGFGVKLMCVLQDLNQLKAHYEASWETFLANSGVITAHGNTDLTTTEYLSKRLGLAEVTRVTTQASQTSGSSEAPRTLGQTLKAFTDKDGLAGGLGPNSQNKSSGASFNRSEQLHKIDLMTADEVARYFAREKETILVLIAGALPIRLKRLSAHRDKFFQERAAQNPFHKQQKGERP